MARFWRFTDGTNNYDVPKRETFIALEDSVSQLYVNDGEFSTSINNITNNIKSIENVISIINNLVGSSFASAKLENGNLILIDNKGAKFSFGPFVEEISSDDFSSVLNTYFPLDAHENMEGIPSDVMDQMLDTYLSLN